ncbi:glutamate-1-semialdehyde 2,1-aminomutase [Acidianus ambivalens]|uniref:Glutamate-1-semialdehyde 2,1-aminomutase n=1 Tax=Acidianus ambivalens TaxID=2283 RepID=A0A650CX79_ACIAM|nr:glutamate-1-semialdehyde 2,1-aminomutase [Acidianus ambivalens]MQL54610.1 glutamate-1-semialdehyde 2,1-aminomutase [Acidianus ambivalens]QGR22416.1 glutamate-1-semialdehyde 2,1-aminomutase [Acidianus ambivalens]
MSSELWKEALRYFPGGVNSPVRAAVKPYPFYVSQGKGAYIYTEDGNSLIDYVLGYGPLILGHANEYVKEKVIEQIEKGWLFGIPSRVEIELARKISLHMPSIEKIRFVNSGTEATMNAIRLARGYTKRDKILKFNGNYHGAHDYALVDAGSAASEFGVPNSEGIPQEVLKTVIVCEYNDLQCVEKKLKNEDVAAVIVEPVMGNMGVIPPEKDFLKGLREITSTYNTLLIFDEVITGFRLSMGGGQEYFGVSADLTTLGKIIGGGFPIGAFGGKREIMDMLTPSGKVFNAGTFNANPISMTAGLATLEVMERENVIEKTTYVAEKVTEELERIKYPHVINRVKNMFQIFFGVEKVSNATEARRAKKEVYLKFQVNLMKNGVYFPPSQFESVFTSLAHYDDNVISDTVLAIKKSSELS